MHTQKDSANANVITDIQSQKTDVAIVGAGPIGLLTAIQIKAQNPSLKVVCFEKRDSYLRTHPLILNSKSFSNFRKEPKLRAFYEKEILGESNWLHKKGIINKKIRIKVNDLEKKLRQFADDIGVDIEQKEIKSLNELERGIKVQYLHDKSSDLAKSTNAARKFALSSDNANLTERVKASIKATERKWLDDVGKSIDDNTLLIGADGAHSNFRENIMTNHISEEHTFKYMINLKYETSLDARMLHRVRERYPTLKLTNFYFTEHISQDKVDPNKKHVSIRFLVNKETYERLKDINFNNLLRIPASEENKEKLGDKLFSDIATVLNARKRCLKDCHSVENAQISRTALGFYKANNVYQKIGEHNSFLVGDSAFGVPFFRSANNGILCSGKLSKAISEHFNDKERGVAQFVKYDKYVDKLASREIIVAKIKNFFIEVLDWFIGISAKVPWQTNFWHKKAREEFAKSDDYLIKTALHIESPSLQQGEQGISIPLEGVKIEAVGDVSQQRTCE